MGKLIFDGPAVRELYEHAKSKENFRKAYDQEPVAALWLVHDQGVYLMSAGIPHLERPDKPEASKIVQARGCDPDVDEDGWDNAHDIVGGDDFAEVIPLATWDELFAKVPVVTEVVIDFNDDDTYAITCIGPKASKVKALPACSGVDALEDF